MGKVILSIIIIIILMRGCVGSQKSSTATPISNEKASTYAVGQETVQTQSNSIDEPNYFPELKDQYDNKYIGGYSYMLNRHWVIDGSYKGCFVEDKMKIDTIHEKFITISRKVIEK